MANPFAGKAKGSSKSKFKSITGKPGGGQVFDGDKQSAPKMAKAVKSGGEEAPVYGGKGKQRLDKYARGGRTGKGTNVNIAIVVPSKGGEPAAPGVPPIVPPGPGGGPPPGIMAPMQPPPDGPPAPPMMRKHGGAVNKKAGGGYIASQGDATMREQMAADTEDLEKKTGKKMWNPGKGFDPVDSGPAMAQDARNAAAMRMKRAHGGRLPTAGAESGVGRLQKAKLAKAK